MRLLQYYFIPIFLFLFSSDLSAQFYLGIESGVSQNILNTNISNQIDTKYSSTFGFLLSVPIKFKIKSIFSINITPCIIQKNYSIKRTNLYNGLYNSFINNYLQTPIIGNIFIFQKYHITTLFETGLFIGYWKSSNFKGQILNIYSAKDSLAP